MQFGGSALQYRSLHTEHLDPLETWGTTEEREMSECGAVHQEFTFLLA